MNAVRFSFPVCISISTQFLRACQIRCRELAFVRANVASFSFPAVFSFFAQLLGVTEAKSVSTVSANSS